MDGPFPNMDEAKAQTLGTLPLIQVTRDSFVSNAEAGEQALLLAEAPVYRRFNKLTRPIDLEVDAAPENTPHCPVNRKTHAPGLIEICQPILRQMLNQSATWVRFDARARQLVPVAPSHEAADLMSTGSSPHPSCAATAPSSTRPATIPPPG
jgi:putative DNA primase/helicase